MFRKDNLLFDNLFFNVSLGPHINRPMLGRLFCGLPPTKQARWKDSYMSTGELLLTFYLMLLRGARGTL
ncbi:hypothetical protein Y032_0011g1456 [Ancylostoma ceylanicum]|uniref:Uncharacterized protein n=1 Tax=Ancylostoma ceylanicum TaxID=53326 RepID=A0A016VF42_9BILA|nr:hypothetical protein Y032_0011g1456 [Ancylostoma ceylanicum]